MINYERNKKQYRNAFTIVELIVVISVIGILAAITIVSYGAWKTNTTTNQLKSDLNGVATAMENARNFGTGYPATVPRTFIPSSDVTLTGGSLNSSASYCVSATNGSQSYFISAQYSTPLVGTCPVMYLDASIKASYPGSGIAWNDLSGNGNSATLVGGVAYSSVNSGVMDINGTTGYITAGSGNSLNFGTGSFTVSYWGKYHDYTYPKTFGSIKKSSPNCFSAGGIGWDFGHTYNASGIDVCINDGVNLVRNTLIFNVGSRPPDLLNKWTNLVYVVNRSSDKVIGYVNGVRQTNEISISTVTGSTDNTNTLTFWTLYGWSVDGMISDVRLYNNSLSDDDIKQNFDALRGRYGV